MTTYELAAVPRLAVGPGMRRRVGALARSLVPPGASVLLVADPGLAATGMAAETEAALCDDGFRITLFSNIKSDPTIDQAEAAVAAARAANAALVVALGGGSALDLGKAVAAIAGGGSPVAAYALCAAPLPATRLRTICMPTTSGTGSETTRTAILSAPDGAKLWFWGDALKPDIALLDPELTRSLPAQLTAATGIDALVHAVEAATNRNANPGNDLYAHEAIRLVARHLEPAVDNPGDLAARGGLQRAAALAGTAIDNCGTAMAHAIGHALASLRPMHHGRAVGVAMLAALPWTVAGDPDGRFAACAGAMGAEPTAHGLVDAYERLLRRSRMRIGVREDFAGVTPEALAAQIARPENIAMVRSTGREAAGSDLLVLARAVLALS